MVVEHGHDVTCKSPARSHLHQRSRREGGKLGRQRLVAHVLVSLEGGNEACEGRVLPLGAENMD
jgi:hypothetical protein